MSTMQGTIDEDKIYKCTCGSSDFEDTENPHLVICHACKTEHCLLDMGDEVTDDFNTK
jgi:hypothetical protein